MTPSPRLLNRRTFLLWTPLLAGVAYLNRGGLWAARRRLRHGAPHPLLGLLGDPGDGVRVGRMYLEACPYEADRAALPELILPGRDARSLPREELRRVFGEQVEQDFAEGDVIEFGGWCLARSEARLFALCALWDSL
jgi:hypothetical protein